MATYGFFETFITFVGAAYLITLGFGLLLDQKSGVTRVNRWWLKGTKQTVKWVFRTACALMRRLFHKLEKMLR